MNPQRLITVCILLLIGATTIYCQQKTLPTGPDLVITDINITDYIGPGISFSGTLKNQGTDPASGTIHTYIYLSTNQSITSGDYQIDDWVESGTLPAGSSVHSPTRSVTVNGLLDGYYYLGGIVDTQHAIAESNEDNNKAVELTPRIKIGNPKPDLIATELAVTSQGWNGDGSYYIHFRNYIKYGETGPAPYSTSYRCFVYLSTDNIITDTDYEISSSLTSTTYTDGETKEFIGSATLHQGDVPNGTYYIGVIDDAWDEIDESTESNNTYCNQSDMITIQFSTEVGDKNTMPTIFSLEQNYPNPFNPETAITYTLAEKSEVNLTVFDTGGRTVNRLVHQEQPAGSYTVAWDGRTLQEMPAPSGIYFCRLRAGSFTKTIRMVLLR